MENLSQIKESIKRTSLPNQKPLVFQDLWSAARNPHQNSELLRIIQSNKENRSRFRALLRSMAKLSQPMQAAAASGQIEKRRGKQFDLEIKPSSRDDGAVFLMIKIHGQIDNNLQHLYYWYNNSYHFVPLSTLENGVAQGYGQ